MCNGRNRRKLIGDKNLTPEQFVCWLQGFLKGMKFGNEKLPLAPLLEEELKKVDLDNIKYEIVKERE